LGDNKSLTEGRIETCPGECVVFSFSYTSLHHYIGYLLVCQRKNIKARAYQEIAHNLRNDAVIMKIIII
jgi:spore maturation protein CgeB